LSLGPEVDWDRRGRHGKAVMAATCDNCRYTVFAWSLD